jgi:hypothetical protein
LNTLNTCSLNKTDQILHPYRTGKIIVPYILIFIFFRQQMESQRILNQMIG